MASVAVLKQPALKLRLDDLLLAARQPGFLGIDDILDAAFPVVLCVPDGGAAQVQRIFDDLIGADALRSVGAGSVILVLSRHWFSTVQLPAYRL